MHQFIKISGLKNEEEFYKKYPTEESFFNDYPQYQTGGETNPFGQYFDTGSYYGPFLPNDQQQYPVKQVDTGTVSFGHDLVPSSFKPPDKLTGTAPRVAIPKQQVPPTYDPMWGMKQATNILTDMTVLNSFIPDKGNTGKDIKSRQVGMGLTDNQLGYTPSSRGTYMVNNPGTMFPNQQVVSSLQFAQTGLENTGYTPTLVNPSAPDFVMQNPNPVQRPQQTINIPDFASQSYENNVSYNIGSGLDISNMGKSAAVRTNNPLNITLTKSNKRFLSKYGVQDGGPIQTFDGQSTQAKFPNVEAGIEAAKAVLLKNYKNRTVTDTLNS